MQTFPEFAHGSAVEIVAMKAVSIMSILLLQKLFCASKPKDHSTCQERQCMFSWIAGDMKGLLSEGHSIQKCLPKTGYLFNDIGHLARSFTK